MDRRELLKMIALVTGSAMIGVDKFGLAAKTVSSSFDLSRSDIALLDDVGETIIPTTGTPGAKAARIGEFMCLMVRDCYTKEQQMVFRNGLRELSQFRGLNAQQRQESLVALERAAKVYNANKKADVPDHYYTMMKQLTLFGYFTSKIGATQALRHVPIPGRYDGAYPYKKGDRAFNDDV